MHDFLFCGFSKAIAISSAPAARAILQIAVFNMCH